MKKSNKVRRNRAIAILVAFVMAFTIYGVPTSVFAKADDTRAADDGKMSIKTVEVLDHPEFQQVYRQSLYKGDAAKGEDPEKWYTTKRGINLHDPREFTFEFVASAETVGEDPDAFLETVKLQYGGHDLSEWANVKSSRGSANTLRDPKGTPYLVEKDKKITKNDDGSYTINLVMDTACPWNPNWTSGDNIPYEGYNTTRQLRAFSSGQSSDNRWWWQTTPTGKGLGNYPMTAVAGEKTLASVNMEIQQYDGGNSWIQKNEFAQSLVKALNGSEVPKAAFADKETGLMASGYVKMDENGNFVKGDRATDVYVEVSILGYGLTDNEKEENKNFNNYARFNAIWNIVVAQDESKVDTYLNETKPTMNTNPDELINKYKDAAPEDVDMINVFYETNVHADEISGIDHTIQFVKDLIEGGKAGKKIDYYTWTEDDMNFRYRDPAEGYEKSEAGHIVKDGYTGRFLDKDARTKKVLDTAEVLDKFITVHNITSNPDGQAGMRRTNRYAFDLNRDAVFSTMPETIALMKDIMKWDPLVEDEWHGYVKQMLIEPCTAPHDPAYDYDLLANNMRNLTYAAGMAVTANTGYDNFLIPWDHYDGGDWDDGGTIYSPMFAELLGCYGYTIEFPAANSDSFDAGTVINYAQLDELLHGTTDVYEGNRLNGPLEDVDGNMRDSHSVDVIDKSMRKNSILAKLETKKRGIENIDSMAADKYFIDKKNGEDKIVGRARPKDADGNTLSFFPDYVVIPKGELQYNIAEGIKAINQMIGWGIDVEVTTEDVVYDGKTIEKGSYVLSMYQANRNVIFEVMSKGYDATGFASMYADIYCNLPDVRGFDSIQIYGKGLFDGKTERQTDLIKKMANIEGAVDEYVVFDSQSTDAVRFVNYLFEKDADVWMLRKDVEGVGSASDYVIKTKDLSKLNKMPNDPVIGQNGVELDGKYLEALPEEAAKLVEPVIQFNSTRTAQTGGPLWYLMDEYLGFGSLKDYNGGNALREGANVIIANNVNANGFQDSWAEAVKKGAGVVFIRNAAGLGKLGVTAPTSTNTFADVAINGTYNVQDSLITSKYKKTSTYYARGYAYSNLPEGSKILFRSLENGEDAFIGGFQNTKSEKTVFGDKVTIFSTMLDGEDFARPVTATVFGQYMDYRSHYQKLLPMLATAIYAGAAGIVDDVVDPVVEDMAKDGNQFTVSVSDDTAIDAVSVYKIKDGKESLISEGEASFSFKTDTSADLKLKVSVADKAGNKAERTFTYDAASGEITSDSAADTAIAMIKALEKNPTSAAVAAAQAAYDKLSDKDKAKVDAALGEGGAAAAIKKAEAAAKKAEADAAKEKAAKETAAKIAKAKKLTVKGLKVKAGKKKATVTYKKTKGATSYQIQYRIKGKKWSKKVTKKAKLVVKKLKKGKKYQFRVRTITKVNGKNVYGKWTAVKTVKIK